MIVPSKPTLLLLTNPLDAQRLVLTFRPYFAVIVATSAEEAVATLRTDSSINCVLAAISTNLWQVTGVEASLRIVNQLDRTLLAWAVFTSDRHAYSADHFQQCAKHNIELFDAAKLEDGIRLEDWVSRAATLARPAQSEG